MSRLRSGLARCGVVVVVVCMAAPLAAQSPVSDHAGPLRTLSGLVTDASTGEPLPGAAVRVADSGIATNSEGRFRLRGLAPDTATVVFTFLGYEAERRVVDLRDGDVTLAVVLAPVEAELGEVQVVGDDALRRSDQAVAVLDGEDLEAARGQTLGETLESINGVPSPATGPTISKPARNRRKAIAINCLARLITRRRTSTRFYVSPVSARPNSRCCCSNLILPAAWNVIRETACRYNSSVQIAVHVEIRQIFGTQRVRSIDCAFRLR